MKSILEFINMKEKKVSRDLLLKFQISLLIILSGILLTVLGFDNLSKYKYVTIVLIDIVFVLFSLLLNIRGKTSQSLYALIITSIVSTWLPLLVDKGILVGDIAPIFYLSLPILIASFFVPPLTTLLIAFIQVLASVLIISFSNELQSLNWISLIVFIIIIAVISLINNYIRYQTYKMFEAQKKSLESKTNDIDKLVKHINKK